jgi:hypothetical protein
LNIVFNSLFGTFAWSSLVCTTKASWMYMTLIGSP